MQQCCCQQTQPSTGAFTITSARLLPLLSQPRGNRLRNWPHRFLILSSERGARGTCPAPVVVAWWAHPAWNLLSACPCMPESTPCARDHRASLVVSAGTDFRQNRGQLLHLPGNWSGRAESQAPGFQLHFFPLLRWTCISHRRQKTRCPVNPPLQLKAHPTTWPVLSASGQMLKTCCYGTTYSERNFSTKYLFCLFLPATSPGRVSIFLQNC